MTDGGKKHSITEAVFGIVLDRNIRPLEAEGLSKEDSALAAALPRLERAQTFQMVIGPNSPNTTPPPVPVAMYRDLYNKQGKITWRVGVIDKSIHANCLEYTRWDETWPEVLKRFAMVDELGVAASDNKVVEIYLHVINRFHTGVYQSPRECLREGSSFIPQSTSDYGAFKMNLGLTPKMEDSRSQPAVSLSIDFGESQSGLDVLTTTVVLRQSLAKRHILGKFLEEDASKDFETLRQHNRGIMFQLLSDQTLEKIGLEKETAGAR